MSQQKKPDLSRRRTLKRLGAFAAYTAPSLTTLLLSEPASADDHDHDHDDDDRPGDPPCDRPHPPRMCMTGSMGSEADTPQRTRLASRGARTSTRA